MRGASGRAFLRLCITAVVLDIVSVWRHMSPRRDDSSDVLSDDQLEEEADEEVHGGAPGPQAVVSDFHVPDVQEQVIEQEIAKMQVVASTEVPQF